METALLFPPTDRLYLIGEFEGEERTIDVNFSAVAKINGDPMRRARQVYAPALRRCQS
jgi:hypothetical protein